MSPVHAAPFRIARVSTRPAVGGAAAHVALLVKHFHAPDYPTLFLSGCPESSEGDFYELRAPDETRPVIVPTLRREPDYGRDLRALRHLVRHFRAFQPHLVDTHLSKAGILGRFAARIARVPLVMHTFHVNIFEGYGWKSPQRAMYLRLEQICATWSNRLISLSNELGHELLELGIGQKSQWQTIQLGLELDQFDAGEKQRQLDRKHLRRELGVAPDAPLVGVVARLAPVKGVKFLLDAAPHILRTTPNAHFVIAGDGPSRERLETQTVALGLAERVHFLGMRADVAQLYRAFDCLALPSLQEGTPISLIEALAARAPVVATDVGGVGRLITQGQTGTLVSPRDADALAQAIIWTLQHPAEAHRRASIGHERMQREWSAQRLVADHQALYAQLQQEMRAGEREPGQSRQTSPR